LRLTVVSSGNTTSKLSVDSAGILLHAGVGHAALAVGDGTALVVLGHGGGEGSEAKDDGCETELHVCGGWVSEMRRYW